MTAIAQPLTSGNTRPRTAGNADNRPLPHDVESELRLLGCILTEPNVLNSDGVGDVTPDDFLSDQHRVLAGHLWGMIRTDQPVDADSLLGHLKAAGDLQRIGGVDRLLEIVTAARRSIGAPIFAGHYSKRIRDAAQRRRAVIAADELRDRALDPASDMAAAWVEYEDAIRPSANQRPAFAKLLTSKEFVALESKPKFLIRDVLVGGQPAVVGGRSKSLKTSVSIDAAISLGSGTPFLGRFAADQVNVGFWSGESGAAVIRETALRVAASKSIRLEDCSVVWGFDLPKLSKADHLKLLADLVCERDLGVIFVDPLYLALLTADAKGRSSDLFFMGMTLEGLSELCRQSGITIVLLHHFRKGGQPDEAEPAGLEELSQSGICEWCRQWLLLQRRTPYQQDGCHELWMRCGGSAGHAGLWAVDLDEGQLDADTFSGRRWDVEVRSVTDARDETRREREDGKAAQREERDDEDRSKVLRAVARFPEGESTRVLRDVAGLHTQRFGPAVQTLLLEGRVKACRITKSGREYDGFRPIKT